VSKWRALAVAIAMGLFATALTVATPSPASAASIVCNKFGGAPIVGGSAGVVTGYYSHSCNSLVGVSQMQESLVIFRDGLVVSSSARFLIQKRVDFSRTVSVPPHGTFKAVMHLDLYGSFSYGSVPGCGRVAPGHVSCDWASVSRFF
jgi:hypothetical protein